jgi:hypothetical protein
LLERHAELRRHRFVEQCSECQARHLVWGGVPDIPDFCRKLIAALAEE